MISEMKNIASECLKHPRRISVWSDIQAKYICPEPAAVLADPVHQQARALGVPVSPGGGSSINPAFKLVFLTAAIGTASFTMLCVALHLATDGAPPPLMEKLIQGMFDLVKVGFGAIVGLLGGKALDQPNR